MSALTLPATDGGVHPLDCPVHGSRCGDWQRLNRDTFPRTFLKVLSALSHGPVTYGPNENTRKRALLELASTGMVTIVSHRDGYMSAVLALEVSP